MKPLYALWAGMRVLAIAVLLLRVGVPFAAAAPSANGVTTVVSVTTGSTQPRGGMNPSISADGRYVAFQSDDISLVSGKTIGYFDVFVHDRQTGQTTHVSVATGGAAGNNISVEPSISGDGRYVAFRSYATNLVEGDTNGSPDVFVHDRQTHETTRASVSSTDIGGNGFSLEPSISADGRYVAFRSDSTNLVITDTNSTDDVFVRDRQAGLTTRVSVASNGAQGNSSSFGTAISADGRYVAFHSWASTLVISDTNGQLDVFVHDRQSAQTTRVSVASNGAEGNNVSLTPSLSGDGRYVAFVSSATNLVVGDTNGVDDIFVHDRVGGQTERISVATGGTQGNGASNPSTVSGAKRYISFDGRYVAFHSGATNLVSGDTNGSTDVFVRDRQAGETARVSVASDGTQGNSFSHNGMSISADGRVVAFGSMATNLLSGVFASVAAVYVNDRGTVSPHAVYLPFIVRSY